MPCIRRARILAAVALLALCPWTPARATFSIAAVDPATGEVGSAGASCISGAIILSDVHPGVGTIHTQSYWNGSNQNNASDLMDLGWSPQEIIDWLVDNDAQGNPTIRQYGIADLVDGGRSAAYTGVNCMNWKGHRLGQTYAIQGNILLGPEIVDDMEAAFLGSVGEPLALRLMSVLQAANVPGADTRCLDDNKPAISAFIRVARPGDEPGGFYLDLNVNNTTAGQNPIDILQDLFDEWLPTAVSEASAPAVIGPFAPHPNPFNPETTLAFELAAEADVRLSVHDVAGRELALLVARRLAAGRHEEQWRPDPVLGSGVYLARLEAGSEIRSAKLLLIK